jgi:hypothetical protein
MMSASVCVICSGARGSAMQGAMRSATQRRCSTSRKTSMPGVRRQQPTVELGDDLLGPVINRATAA